MSKKKTHDEYVAEVARINSNIEVVDQYVGNRIKILHRCKIDQYEWSAAPYNILLNKGCPKCAGNIKRTHDQYMRDVAVINNNIKVVGAYINLQTPILHICKIDGHQWLAKPNNILHGKGCPVCAGNMSKTHTDYIKELYRVNPNIEAIEEYAGAKIKILHRCKIDDNTWSVAPSSTLMGHGCPECQRKTISQKLMKDHDTYVRQVEITNPNIEVLEEYRGSEIAILHMCKIDGHKWIAKPGNILYGTGCPHCNQSHGEKQIAAILTEHSIEFVQQKTFDACKDKSCLPFDFYLPKHNVCIEYDGHQHFKPVDFAGKGEEWAKKQFLLVQKHDEIKNQYCKDNNINLLRIPYFKNIEYELNNFLFI